VAPEWRTNSGENRSISIVCELDLVRFCGCWPVGKCKKGYPSKGKWSLKLVQGPEGGIPRSDRSDWADGGRLRASVGVTDEAEYVSAPDRSRGIVRLPMNRHLLACTL
jgi:hypothetical protein